MKNLTVSLDDETYRRARVKAAEQDTSVSAIVRRMLTEFAGAETDFERLKRMEREAREKVGYFSARENVPREELYDRKAR